MINDHRPEFELESHEIVLDDQYAPKAPTVTDVVLENEQKPLSLPAALCDELLLQEIQSIPEKMGFKIGEVAEILNVKQYVLRYWESEFDILKPKKASNNQRYFTKKDVENVFLIRKLLHRDRFSIEGGASGFERFEAIRARRSQEGERNFFSPVSDGVRTKSNGRSAYGYSQDAKAFCLIKKSACGAAW